MHRICEVGVITMFGKLKHMIVIKAEQVFCKVNHVVMMTRDTCVVQRANLVHHPHQVIIMLNELVLQVSCSWLLGSGWLMATRCCRSGEASNGTGDAGE